jgi:CAAX amino terminal protease family.
VAEKSIEGANDANELHMADLLLVVIAVAAIPGLSILAGRTYARKERSELNLVGRYWFIIIRGFLLSLLIIFVWSWAGRPFATLGLDIPVGYRGRIGFILDGALACYYVYALLVRRLSPERIAATRGRLKSYRILPETRDEFVLFPFVGIVGSIFEELLYRGFLLWMFTPLAGVWGAALLSSLTFGVGHAYQGWIGIVRTTIIGFAFATGYVLTHSLWWLIVAHIMISIFGDLFARRLMRLAPTPRQ